MFLSIKELEVKKIRFDAIFRAGELDFSGAAVRQVVPLHVQGSAELLPNTDGEVRVQAQIEGALEGECDRCLGNASWPIDAKVDLFYKPAAAMKDADDEIGIDEGEAEIGFYDGAGLELEQIVREQLLLSVPMQKVCSESCRGICPICGSNRNQSACVCKVVTGDDRWSALQNL